ncbi:MAG: 2,3-bisphosphoglycerate-independent phosphoglycerate mutase [Candidatus Aenigmarchaeota archaeon]|nr:2,3-bisphosphoglycerate-independent phosphoglycerate mutase [Candidatus Aenigmarchaeota archaeon]
MKRKIILIVLDGAGDKGKNTPFQTASKPNIDSLASRGVCGLIDIGYKKYVESDIGYMTLLGFFTKEYYTGRGYLEALGLNLKPKEGELCIRGNFATLDSNGNVTDRRAGREETGLEEVCEELDGMEIDGVRFHVRKGAGHRVVIMMEGKLSMDVVPNDPKLEGKPLPQIGSTSPAGKKTASVLNKFLYRARKIITESHINGKRKVPTNTIIIRNFGMRKDGPSFEETYGMSGACVAGVPIAKGISRYLGIRTVDVPGATGSIDTDLKAKLEKTIDMHKKYDFVWLHINGTDILSHDARREEKAKFIEKIDREVVGKLIKAVDMKSTTIVITCDHRTDSEKDYKYYRHTNDPVPALVSGAGVEPGRVTKFDEYSCEKGSFVIKGNGLIPYVLRVSK